MGERRRIRARLNKGCGSWAPLHPFFQPIRGISFSAPKKSCHLLAPTFDPCYASRMNESKYDAETILEAHFDEMGPPLLQAVLDGLQKMMKEEQK